jgi:cold shock protein
MQGTMETGTVKTVTDKGFGFISREGSDKDLFFHENSLEGELATRKLKVGDKVTFDVEETPKGLNAVNIKLVE